MSTEGKPAPPLPEISLIEVEDRTPDQPPGFLRLLRRVLVARYADGSDSGPFSYDEVDRKNLDAAVIVAHFVGADGRRNLYLRSALRPPLLRRANRSPCPEREGSGGLWELPAGLIEAHEQSATGVRDAARRELMEELGFDVEPSRLLPLGPSSFPCPAVIAERHFFFEVHVDPAERREPALDGSALEAGGVVLAVTLDDALTMCRSAQLEDAKSELGVRRLAEKYEHEHESEHEETRA